MSNEFVIQQYWDTVDRYGYLYMAYDPVVGWSVTSREHATRMNYERARVCRDYLHRQHELRRQRPQPCGAVAQTEWYAVLEA